MNVTMGDTPMTVYSALPQTGLMVRWISTFHLPVCYHLAVADPPQPLLLHSLPINQLIPDSNDREGPNCGWLWVEVVSGSVWGVPVTIVVKDPVALVHWGVDAYHLALWTPRVNRIQNYFNPPPHHHHTEWHQHGLEPPSYHFAC